MLEMYLRFVSGRHQVWLSRQAGLPQEEWTADEVLRAKKFTNVYRVLDAGSQFVVKELLGGTYEDTLMRVFLYRYNNRPEPWIYFREKVGRYPVCEDLSPKGKLFQVWGEYKEKGGPIFGNAYQMFVGAENKGLDRLTWILQLTRNYFYTYSYDRIVPEFEAASSQSERLEVLKTLPRCGEFMGMQILTDFGYSRHLQADENSFIIAGPGAKRGAALVEPTVTAEQAIHGMTERLNEMLLERGLPIVDLFVGGTTYREPSLMDIQNTFCEFQKYVRYDAERANLSARVYKPAHPGLPDAPTLPSHWAERN